jgi:NAD(P)-dependent dehydrogenase (short-subunit alcohol dehydrogenase family)
MELQANIFVTGANRGIGSQLAARFLERGYTVFGTVRPETRADPSAAQARAP